MQFTVKQARKYANLTQNEMADRMGIHRNTYMKIERNISLATVRQINQIAQITGIPMTDIFLLEDSTLVE